MKKAAVLFLVFAFIINLGCSGQPLGQKSNYSSTIGGNINLQGVGATFPKPIYEKWVSEYQKINPTIRINYTASGSGAGQKAILSNTADFGASDDPMKDEDLANTDILHIPTVLGAVIVTYNLAEAKNPLKLSAETIAGIYLGKIKKWNDPKIKADNQNINLPDTDISPVYRADSSGTTAVFTEFLSISSEWKEKVGADKQPSWITGVGIGAKGNDGVTGQIKNIPNSIGYVEVAFAQANNLPMALIKNKAGNFVEPSIENVSAAALGAISTMPDDLRAKITNSDGEKSYPIASYTYILVHQDQKDSVRGKALIDFLWWAIHDGEAFAHDLHYAPLPEEVVKKVEAKINSTTSNSKPIREVKSGE